MTVVATSKACEVCGIQKHLPSECAIAKTSSVHQVNDGSSSRRLPFNPYPNTYNEGWKQHPKFSYKN